MLSAPGHTSRATVAALALIGVLAACTSAGSLADPSPSTSQVGTLVATPSATPTAAPIPAPSQRPEGTPSGPSTTNPPNTSSDGRASVDVVITYGGWNTVTAQVEFGAYVAGVIEDGGTCTLELTKDSQVIRTETIAVADASTTTCGQLSVARTELGGGTWIATIGYESATSRGKSSATDVEVP